MSISKLHLICSAICLLFATTTRAAESAPSKPVSLAFVGDIMLAHDEAMGKLVEQGSDPFQPCSELLSGVDYAIGNLECVVATSGEAVPKKYNFRADPRVLPILKRHFDAVSVANNHSGDFGKDAFVEQCVLLERAKLRYFGGGRNKSAAHKPWIIERNGIRMALLAYCEVYLASFQATDDVAGIAWSEHDKEVLDDIRSARTKYHADVVIPFMHWGPENEPVSERQKTFSRQMIDAGADVVVGAHPHVTQGVEYYNQHLIVYSLGNFVFNGFTNPDNLTGWLLRLDVNRDGMQRWDIVTVKLDERGVPIPDFNIKSPNGTARSKDITLSAPLKKWNAEQ